MVWVELCLFTARVFLRLVEVTFKKVFPSVIILDSGGLKVPGEIWTQTQRKVYTLRQRQWLLREPEAKA